MAVVDPRLISSDDVGGPPLVGLGVRLLDEYLEFVAGRCRPNTVLTTTFDLKVFFGVVDKAPAEVTTADVLGFITAQRTGGDGLQLRSVDTDSGVSSRTDPTWLRDGLPLTRARVEALNQQEDDSSVGLRAPAPSAFAISAMG